MQICYCDQKSVSVIRQCNNVTSVTHESQSKTIKFSSFAVFTIQSFAKTREIKCNNQGVKKCSRTKTTNVNTKENQKDCEQ